MKTEVIEKMKEFIPYLNEEQARIYAASEAKVLGRGGKSLIRRTTGNIGGYKKAGISWQFRQQRR